jgi:hypothetical protein
VSTLRCVQVGAQDIPAGRDGAGNTGDTKSGKKVALRRAGQTKAGRMVQKESTQRIGDDNVCQTTIFFKKEIDCDDWIFMDILYASHKKIHVEKKC